VDTQRRRLTRIQKSREGKSRGIFVRSRTLGRASAIVSTLAAAAAADLLDLEEFDDKTLPLRAEDVPTKPAGSRRSRT
jgi:hypothetical protein